MFLKTLTAEYALDYGIDFLCNSICSVFALLPMDSIIVEWYQKVLCCNTLNILYLFITSTCPSLRITSLFFVVFPIAFKN